MALDITFQVLRDDYLQQDIVIGREILAKGVMVNMSSDYTWLLGVWRI